MTPPPRFAVARRDAPPLSFDNVVDAKRYLDRHDDALRAVRLSDGVVMAYKAKVTDAEMAHLASIFRKHD